MEITTLALLAITFLAVFNGMYGTLSILGISNHCDTKYKCPYCKKKFDIKVSPEKLNYCPKCGKKLDEAIQNIGVF